MKKSALRAYAKLIAVKGADIQPGQEVIINCGLDQPEFISMLVDECYKAKAKKVVVEWNYQPVQKLHFRHQSVTTLSKLPNYEEAKLKYRLDNNPAMIHIESEDPDGMKGINQEKMMKVRRNRFPIMKPYLDAMENKYQWCIAAVPGAAWAKKVFPNLRVSQAMEKLWEAILYTARVDDDPVEAWNVHNKDLSDRCAYLNDLGIRNLRYKSANGTDFTVGMIPEAQFCGGKATSLSSIDYNPNIPSEECFISPMRGVAEGTVVATKPLSYNGELIENFSIRFEGGKAVEWHAEKNEELLTKMLTIDEGASYLGECALVPFDSPINNSGILFYNTLFDENACCHLAVGMGFADTIRDFEHKTLDECRALGVNDSMVHVDFMIGSADLAIDAECADGKTVPIFRDGNWAF